MTKFEEELSSLPVSQSTKYTEYWNKAQLLTVFKDWQPDEEFQTKENELKRLQKLNHLYKKAKENAERLAVDRRERLNQAQDELEYLESQLQQRDLPVVPECVGEFITKVKKAGNNLTFAFNSKFDECPAKYWNKAIVWRLNHPEEFALAFITDKYEVEKPQLFYLKNKLTGLYLYKKPLGGYGEDPANYIKDLTNDFKFTQKEIDGMDVQSYEKKDEYKGE